MILKRKAMIMISLKRSLKRLFITCFISDFFLFVCEANREGRIFTKRPYILWPPQENVDSVPNMMPHHSRYPSCKKLGEKSSFSVFWLHYSYFSRLLNHL
jgi:hypothetical protein